MSVSDRIERRIKRLLEQADGDVVIVRNEMAEAMNVVPSQITYVLSTRFTTVHGYVIESQRGGGGFIRLRRVKATDDGVLCLMHVVNAIGDSVSAAEARVIVNNLSEYGAIDQALARALIAAVSHNALSAVDPARVNRVRAAILKHAVAALAAG